MAKKCLLVVSGLLLAVFLSGCVPTASNLQPPSYGLPTTQCYLLEPNISFEFNGKIYIRIRANVSMIKSKFGEFQEVGALADGRKIYFLSKNHQGDSLTDFLFLFLDEDPNDKNAYLWDVYIDKVKENDLPDFIKNCQETGGLIPMVEGPDAPYFPPQIFKYEEIENNQMVCVFADSVCAKYYLRIEKVEKLPDGSGKIGTLTKKVRDETHSYLVHHHNGVLYLEDQESHEIHLYNPSDTLPPFVAKTRDPSLQLGTLKFITTTQWTWATPSCKPVIYLYPEEPTKLSIKVNPYGQLTKTNPPYDPKKGWQVLAYPDGTIRDTQHETRDTKYPYLFYEGVIIKFKTPDKGWMVKKEDLPEFFGGILPQLGLNEKEANDFQDYWLGRLIDSPYYLIAPLPLEEIKRIEPVEFSQKPETFIRVRFYFKGLNEPALILPPKLPSLPERKGFTVVEWGGLYKN